MRRSDSCRGHSDQVLFEPPCSSRPASARREPVKLEVLVSYQRYSKILRWLTISLISYIAVLFIVRVDWRAVAHATFLPKIQSDRSYIAALIAVFGTTISSGGR